MNSFLQQLYMIPHIRQSFLALHQAPSPFIQVIGSVLLGFFLSFLRMLSR
jgi:hypothetical protein